MGEVSRAARGAEKIHGAGGQQSSTPLSECLHGQAICPGSVIGVGKWLEWAGVGDALVRPVRVVELLELP
jgi:hypothetical protein